MPDQVKLTFRLGGCRQQRMKFGRERIFPERNSFDPLSVGILQSEHDTLAAKLKALEAEYYVRET